jgi:hypothetical protein
VWFPAPPFSCFWARSPHTLKRTFQTPCDILGHMGEYAPQDMLWLGNQIVKAVPGAKLSGIIGDRAHVYGYHRARSVLPGDDYSVVLEADQAGDADAAAALDISLPPAGMKQMTARLMAVCKDKSDPRRKYIREFFGTLDGHTVTGWDNPSHSPATSDDSHLWHIHLSFYRRHVNNRTAMEAVLSIFTNTGDDDMPKMISLVAKGSRPIGLDWSYLWVTDDGPTFLDKHAYFTATVTGHIPNLPPGTTVKARLVEVEKVVEDGKDTYPVRKTYDAYELISTEGNTDIHFTQVGSLDKGHRLRAQVKVYLNDRPEPVAFVDPRVRCLYSER